MRKADQVGRMQMSLANPATDNGGSLEGLYDGLRWTTSKLYPFYLDITA